MLPRHFILGTDDRWRSVEDLMRQLGYRAGGLIEVVHAAQQAFG